MKWHYAYQGILSVFFVLRIISLVGLIFEFFNTINRIKYDYPSASISGWFIIWFIVTVILSIVRLVYTRKVINGLKTSLSRYEYSDLKTYYVLSLIWYFFSRLPYSIIASIIATLIYACVIIPCFIYYYKRRSLFGITFFCDICGKEKRTKELFEKHENDADIKYCSSCYNQTKNTTANNNEKSTPDSTTKEKEKINQKTIAKKNDPSHEKDQTTPIISRSSKAERKTNVLSQNETQQETIRSDHICFCRKCGLHLDDDSVFCKRCGTKIKSCVCKRCGCELDSDSIFCKKCGTKVDD